MPVRDVVVQLPTARPVEPGIEGYPVLAAARADKGRRVTVLPPGRRHFPANPLAAPPFHHRQPLVHVDLPGADRPPQRADAVAEAVANRLETVVEVIDDDP